MFLRPLGHRVHLEPLAQTLPNIECLRYNISSKDYSLLNLFHCTNLRDVKHGALEAETHQSLSGPCVNFFLSFCNLPAQYARPLLTYNVSIPDMLVPLLQHRTYTLAMLDIRVLLRKPSTFEHFFSGCFTNLPPLHKFSAFSRALNRFISFQPLRGLSITLRTFAYIVSLQSFSA